MAEYIEREAAMLLPELPKEYRHYQTDNLDDAYEQGWYDALCCLEHIPVADVAPVVHGRCRALRKYDARRTYRCSVCGRAIRLSLAIDINEYAPYCNCGARMDGGDDGETD